MLCIKCKQEIPDISVYCMFCGKKQSAEPRAAKKVHNPNGTGTVYKRGSTWTAQLRVKRHGFTASRTKGGFATKAEAIGSTLHQRVNVNTGAGNRQKALLRA